MESSSNKLNSKSDLINKLKSVDQSIFNEFAIDFLYLGGSWVNESNNWWSDIDIFISKPDFLFLNSKKKRDFLIEFGDILTKLTQLRNFQVSVLQALPLHVQFSAINDGIVIFETLKLKRLNYIENLLNQYYDHQIWYDHMLNESLGIKYYK